MQRPTVPDEVKQVSPQFVQIYEQAAAAESFSLGEIAGMGYRKALEFLIKDYCIKQNPSDAEAIKETLLGPCIQKYVADAKVKQCAERATWLGNDETHYVRRWQDKDVQDLKTLIELTMIWIRSDLLTLSYVSSMQSKP